MMRLLLTVFSVVLLHVHTSVVSWEPVIKIREPLNGQTINKNTSKLLHVSIMYDVYTPSPAYFTAQDLASMVVSLQERHGVDPGQITLPVGKPVHVTLTEPGTYIFELLLQRMGLNDAFETISSDYVLFNIVEDYKAQMKASIPRAFDSHTNYYSFDGTPMNILPRFIQDQALLSQMYPNRSISGYYESLPVEWQRVIKPTKVVLIGGVIPPFDGTKQFIIQYETIVDRRLLAFTHLDMLSGKEVGEKQLMAGMLRSAGVPLQFRQVVVKLQDFGSSKGFLLAGARMARARGWCDLPGKLQSALSEVAGFFSEFDGMWRINHDANEEYIQQAMRLANPSSYRVNDLVSRMDLPCHYNRLKQPTAGQPMATWDSVDSACRSSYGSNNTSNAIFDTYAKNDCIYLESEFAAEASRMFGLPGTHGSLAHGQFVRTPTQEKVSTGLVRNSLWDQRPQDLHSLHMNGVGQFHPSSYELLVAPSHFVAQHDVSKSYYQPILVVPGLNSRKVQVIPRAESSRNVCRPLWGDQLNSGEPPTVVAFIGRIAREKGIGIYIEAVAALKGKINTTTRFVVIGGPGSEQYGTVAQKYAEDLGVRHLVQFVGFTPPTTLMSWYRHSCIDIVATPYLRPASESFGLVLIEAMEAGLPVVHFGIGGLQDYTRDKVNSLQAETSSAVSFAQALQVLIVSPEARRRISNAGMQFVQQHLTERTVAGTIERELRSQHVASKLMRAHIPGGLHEAKSSRQSCSSDGDAGFSRSISAVTWGELMAAKLTSGPQSRGWMKIQLLQSMQGDVAWDLGITPRDNQFILHVGLQSDSFAASSGLAAAQSLVPGFPDILCADDFSATADAECHKHVIARNTQALLSSRVRAGASLCWSTVGQENACAYISDLATTRCDSDLLEDGICVIKIFAGMPAGVDLIAIVESQMPHLVHAAVMRSAP